jgi:hypothetical protein
MDKKNSLTFKFYVASVSITPPRNSIMKGHCFEVNGQPQNVFDLILPYSHTLGDVTLGKAYTVEIKEE